MGLQLISSNKIETLLAELADRLSSSPLASPFTAETMVVPSQAMGRWINLQLARQHGIAANIQYLLPAAWIWHLTEQQLGDIPAKDPIARDLASWKIHDLLPGLLDHPEFSQLQHYLKQDSGGVKRWQLAQQIADVFDRYQFYRPELIRSWCRGQEKDWQPRLWRELIADHRQTHRVAVLDRLLGRLHGDAPDRELPERVSLFALSSLPPLFIQVLHALANHTEINLYQHSPTDQYWADLKSKKTLSRVRVQTPDLSAYFDTGNELLASWGRQGQALQDLLLSDPAPLEADWEHYQPPLEETLLGRVQQAIFQLDEHGPGSHFDDSVQLHICHSPLRECQVLHDGLLRLMEQDKTLRPEDVLVMIPEISRYAPYIEAVFHKDQTGARPYIRWNISDISVADEHPLIRIFFQLLNLPGSRFTASELLSYLEVPELAARFGLDDAECETIRDLLGQTEVRWGMDEQHKQELGLPAVLENTWKQAAQRLFAGYAMGDVDNWNDIAPLAGTEGDAAISLGKFWLLFNSLGEYRKQLAKARPADQWQLLLNQLLDDFFDDHASGDGKLQQIRDSLDDLQQLAGKQILSHQLALHWLTTALGNQHISGRYFSGGVTFCGMHPMRSLPFRVICLVGMNDQAFPRRDTPVEFDLMADQWRAGDPRKGDEDRYLLLETLLCVREKLYISYTGRDLKDNSERQPSVLVRELLDFIGEDASTGITHIHPLQAFSPRNYQGKEASYDSYWCKLANLSQQASQPLQESDWPGYLLPEPAEELREVNLRALHRFLQHPIQYFCNTRLHIRLQQTTLDEDDEPFELDGLQRWRMKAMITTSTLREQPVTAAQLKARGLLPHGSLADIAYSGIQQEVAPLLEALTDYNGVPTEPRHVDLPFADGFRLSGQLDNYLPGHGLLHVSPAKIKGRTLLALWLDHLALCAGGQLEEDEVSRLVGGDGSWQFSAMGREDALSRLHRYLGFYWEGLQRPLPLFPAASFAYAQHQDDESRALKKAGSQWSGNGFMNIPGDQDDPYVQLVLRGLAAQPLQDPEFAELAVAFYEGIFTLGEEQ